MKEDTKACNLTEYEVKELIRFHGNCLFENSKMSDKIERINYLHKRLKEFKKETPAQVVAEDKASEGWK